MVKQQKTEVPAYTEAEAKTWLSWLARGMQTHGQTVFMIEQLQPSWLPKRWQQFAYTFFSRVLFGLFLGLIFGIAAAWISDAIRDAIFSWEGEYGRMVRNICLSIPPDEIHFDSPYAVLLRCGVAFGLSVAFFDLYRFVRTARNVEGSMAPTGWQQLRGVLILGLVFVCPLGLILVVSHQSRTIEFGNLLRHFDTRFKGLALSGDAHWLVTLGNEKTENGDLNARLWDLTANDSSPLRPQRRHVDTRFSEDGRRLIMVGEDEDGNWSAPLWDLIAGDRSPVELPNPKSGVAYMRFTPNGRWLVMVGEGDEKGENKRVTLWHLTADDPSPVEFPEPEGRIYDSRFTSDGQRLVIVVEDRHNSKTVQVLDLTTPDRLPVEFPAFDGRALDCRFTPDGQRLVIVGLDKDKKLTTRLWNLSTAVPSPVKLSELEGQIYESTLSSDGRWLVTVGRGKNEKISGLLWDLTAIDLSPTHLSRMADRPYGIAISPDGRWLVTQGWNSAMLWDLTAADVSPMALTTPESGIRDWRFTPDDKRLAMLSSRSAMLWDLAEANPTPVTLSDREGGYDDLTLSPDGHWLVTVSEDKDENWNAQVWDLTAADPWKSPVRATADKLLELRTSKIGDSLAILVACIFAAVFAILYGWHQRTLAHEIQTVETLNWSWARGRKGVLIGAPGLTVGALYALWFAVIEGEAVDRLIVAGSLLFALCLGLIPGLFLVTVGGLSQGVTEMKTSPNQGIMLTKRSAVFVAVVFGLSVAMILAMIPLIGSLAFNWPFGLAFPLKVVLIIGLISAFIAGSWFGGLDVFNHYVLRLMLYFCGYTPFNYVRFLDYAAKDLNFLQKVGGGYIFIHRMLLDHFVGMEAEGKADPQDLPPLAAPTPSDIVPSG